MEIIFTMKSTNDAIMAEEILLKEGYDVKAMPLPSVIKAGCGICLRLPPAQAELAQKELTKNKIQPEALYMRETSPNGSQYKVYEKGVARGDG